MIEWLPRSDSGAVVAVRRGRFILPVAAPMTEQCHVKRIDLIAPANPVPLIASYFFTPACATAEVRARIRLARTQRVAAVAELSDGRRMEAGADVLVTLGACVEDVYG